MRGASPAQLVDLTRGEEISEKMRAALAEQLPESALGQGRTQRRQIDGLRAQHQHLVVTEQSAGLGQSVGSPRRDHQHVAGPAAGE